MKKRNTKLLMIPLLAMLLVGCNNISSSATPVSEPASEEIVSSEEVPSSTEVLSSEESSESVSVSLDTTQYELATTPNYSNRALDHSIGMTALDSVGVQKMMVVPVVFTDTVSHATPEVHDMISRAFFGASEETGWESVASYYHKSSYGNLTLTGELLPYFYSTMNTYQFANLEVSPSQQFVDEDGINYWDQTHYLIEEIYNTLPAETFLEYDQDGDGWVDAFWMVYIANIYHVGGGENDPFWAYKFYWNRYPRAEKPTPNTYAWASFNFAKTGDGYSFEEPDSHTFIHETGHLFGLPDYYDYDRKTAPAGAKDMMDHNIIDHNIYSKYRLNWTKPYVVKGHADIYLRPAETSGDFILIKDGWNGHTYDEYILIEYYTPTGLNEKDSSGDGYTTRILESSSTIKGFTIPGVRMWHVDSRLLTYLYEEVDGTYSLVSTEWGDEIVNDEYSYTVIGPSNTTSRSRDPEGVGQNTNKLLHLMDAQGVTGRVGNWLRTSSSARDQSLFQTGQIIAADDWKRYIQTSTTFNDGTEVGYSVEIGAMDENGVQIIIRKAPTLA
ncbi:MAG: hypothetical protein BWX74_00704 [Tenericutes bacterium ADurb.Bin087]|nr:MAG: hypothetical protein BWX74_00704 [Tenericutes bacterium ADurb.Bin087]